MKKKIIIGCIILLMGVSGLTAYFAAPWFKCEEYPNSDFTEAFEKYFISNNIKEKSDNLKQDLDEISIEYIDKFIENSKYWNKCINHCKGYIDTYHFWDNLWTEYDKKLFKDFKESETPEIYKKLDFNIFIYQSIYGLKDLPISVLKKINGKDILDIGAWPGDSAYTFHKFFPKSHIYSFEPVETLMQVVLSHLDIMKKEEKNIQLIHPIQKGVAEKEYESEITFSGQSNIAKIVSLDNEYPKIKIKKNSLGLIKIDTEGFESKVIEGAEKVIKKYKPVLVIAIYHTPYDFFEMKDKLKKINPSYKFMIRRSEDVIPDADLVLIAY